MIPINRTYVHMEFQGFVKSILSMFLCIGIKLEKFQISARYLM